jgi:hypothetical protein
MLALRAMNARKMSISILLVLLIPAACTPAPNSESMVITVIADGRQRSFVYDQHIPVGQFLELEEVSVTLGDLDRVNPPSFTQISDGMTITVVHVEEQTECQDRTIPYQQQRVPIEGLAPGEERLAQPGVNGIEQACYRTTFWDGQVHDRVEIPQPVLVQAPQDEIIWVGVDATTLEPAPITGTLAYISHGNAWIMRGSSATKRLLTNSGRLDDIVFELSSNGNQLLYTQSFDETAEDADIYFNTLWVILDARANEPVASELSLLNNILYAEWVPNQPFTFSYSAGEARESGPGWQAFNDLWLMRIDEADASLLSPRNLVEASAGGVYGWWGTQFRWGPDGSALAWSRADSVGLVDLETGELRPLLQFPVYLTYQDWIWQPSLSWSPDGSILLTIVHGPPFGSEQPENSPVFNVAVTAMDGSFQTEIVERAGMWAEPHFSPFVQQESEFPQGYIAYLQARHPLNSRNDEYDLYVADRDGSNARPIFPEPGQPGISSPELAWSPDGRQLALIYQGNLWVIDVSSGHAQQLTIDGGASSPRWVS